MTIYLVRDGIVNIGFVSTKNNQQLINTNFYLITYDFKKNFGYIEKKDINLWRLYTSIGQKINESRYHHFNTLEECVNKLKELNGNKNVLICNSYEIETFKTIKIKPC